VTVAQVDPLLDALRSRGNARMLHPTDRVDLWLDRDALVPVSLDVRAAPTDEREEWAARTGFTDDDDQVLLSVRWSNIAIDDDDVVDGLFPAPPPGAIERNAGFVAGPVGVPAPSWLPPGMALAREGTVQSGGPAVEVRAWSDGRAWVKVAATTDWPGGRLFGEMGAVVREVSLGNGVAYVDEAGERVALHGDAIDVVVSGSIATGDLLHVARSLALSGVAVPSDWSDAGTVTAAALRAEGWLVPGGAGDLAARREGDTVTLVYAGPGARGYVLVEAPGTGLGPPFDPNARAIEVRATNARWSPDLGTLEWVEDERVIALTSETMSLGELVAVADGMVSR
jgi:hypothetical protein